MQDTRKWKSIRNVVEIALILAFFGATLALEFVCFVGTENELHKTLLCRLVQQLCGSMATILLMIRLKVQLFGKPQKWLYLIPCLLIAIDNFQFSSFLRGKMELVYNDPLDILLFGGYCLSIGLFEECIFRGVLFSILAGIFSQDKKGFLWTYFLSSLLFGLMHVFNGFSVGVLLQMGYSVLTGGLFAFCLIKTKNIVCCAAVHGLYNFCGTLFGTFDSTQGLIGLGAGVVFDVGTIVTMLVVSVLLGIFVLYKVFTYSEAERGELYQKLGIKPSNKPKEDEGRV